MKRPDVAPISARVVPGMFHTSARLRHLVRLLRPFPRGVGEAVLAGAALVDGIVRPRRFRQAYVWATAQRRTGGSAYRLALALLANHGRFCAEEALLGVSTAAPASDVVVEGADRLPPAGTGAILLGFHLGPPRVWFHLRALGYPVRLGGALVTSSWDTRWKALIDAGEVLHIPGGAPASRLAGLYQIRDALRAGELVYLASEGPFGREGFRLELPGGPLIARAGWLVLRRLTGAPTFPMLVHREGTRRVIVIHPALPPSPGDVAGDAAQCRAALAPLIESYVRRFPAQCRYLAFPPWATTASTDAEALDSEGRAT